MQQSSISQDRVRDAAVALLAHLDKMIRNREMNQHEALATVATAVSCLPKGERQMFRLLLDHMEVEAGHVPEGTMQ